MDKKQTTKTERLKDIAIAIAMSKWNLSKRFYLRYSGSVPGGGYLIQFNLKEWK